MPVLFIVSPAWRRFSVTKLALAQRQLLIGELAARGIEAHGLIVADDANLDIARSFGMETLERGNEQLGRKVNDGIEYACKQGADYVVAIGSDDWVHVDMFTRLPKLVAEPPEPTAENPVVFWDKAPEAVTGREIALANLLTGRLQRCRVRGKYGVIPWILPRKLLEPSGFRPVRDGISRGIDGSLVAGLRVMPNWVFHDPHPLCRVDFKSRLNLTSYEGAAENLGDGPEAGLGALAELYPPELVELARQTHKELIA